MRWFAKLPIRRKVLLFATGGMLTLVFDTFVVHFSWTNFSMKWTQWIPIAYGVIATVLMTYGTLVPMSSKSLQRINSFVGALALVVGLVGVALHGGAFRETLEGETLTIVNIGKAMALSPPLVAPGGFCGLGFLLMTLSRLCPEPVSLPQREVPAFR